MRASNLFEHITRQIIDAIEADGGASGQRAVLPWHCRGEALATPINAVSGRPYRGVNVLLLWAATALDGHSSGCWATYRQWAAAGAQVRKGERSTAIVFWKSSLDRAVEQERDSGDDGGQPSVVARVYHVFNASQVDGYEEAGAVEDSSAHNRIEGAEVFFRACGAEIAHGGDAAFYTPDHDRIQMPCFEQFRDPAGYYAVLGHEYIHWTGARHRLNRDLRHRFGSDAYALEELVAELGSAFLAGYLGIATEPRSDHAAYIASWLSVLRRDARAVVTASAKAQQAVDYLINAAASRE